MQRRKGATGELEVAHLFQEAGFHARRGGMGQSQSSHITPDVVVKNLPFLWIEVKRQAQTRPLEALKQADKALEDDKYENFKCAVCFTRNNGEKWEVWTRVADLLAMNVIGPTELPPDAAIQMRPDYFFQMLRRKYDTNQLELKVK